MPADRTPHVPASRVERFVTLEDGQTEVAINVYQGEARFTVDNIHLGRLLVTVPPVERAVQTNPVPRGAGGTEDTGLNAIGFMQEGSGAIRSGSVQNAMAPRAPNPPGPHPARPCSSFT